MFEETLKVAQGLKGTQIRSGVIPDAEGYIDRQCPTDICEFKFKIHQDDWRDKVRDEEVFCPSCRHASDSSRWYTYEQVEFQKRQALAFVAGQINQAMRRDAATWNRNQPRSGFIRVTLRVEGGNKDFDVPASVSDPMRLQITCPACSCRYGVIGAAYFCPGCGHNSADLMLSQSLKGITSTLDALATIAKALPDADTSKIMEQAVVEGGLQNVVTAFQRYAESLHERHPSAPKARRNLFQNLNDGSAAWKAAFGNGYDRHLVDRELMSLGRHFQQRHLLAHRQGLVDEDYCRRSGDRTYQVGQRIVIKVDGVRKAVLLVEKLCAGLATDASKSGG